LLAEGVSINRIAALFGVTRQRISALVRKRHGELVD
jgi:plasmid maintenance system antidote protein VapI